MDEKGATDDGATEDGAMDGGGQGTTGPGPRDDLRRRRDERFLGEAPLLAGLTTAERGKLLAAAAVRRFEAGEALFHQGDGAEAFFLLTDGRVKLTQVSAQGDEVVVRFVAPGQPLAAISLLPGRVYPVSARAAAPSRTLTWSGDRLRCLTREVPELLLVAGEAMADHMEEVTGRLREVSTERVAQRLARALVRLGEQVGREVEGGLLLDLPLTRRDLAEMTGTTLYTVSRQLSAWEGEGLVSTGRERVVLRDVEGLAQLAGG